MARRSIYAKVNRVRDWLWWFAERHPKRCYICGKRIPTAAFLKGDATDGILLHHVRMSRRKTRARRLEVAHRGCNVRFHRQLERNGKDVRTKKAIRHYGHTPKVRSDRIRRQGWVRQLASAS